MWIKISLFSLLILTSFSWAKLNKLENLGKSIFNDTGLSEPIGQSCSSCHQKDKAFANNEMIFNGANNQLFGNRNTPSISYSQFSPRFKYDEIEGQIVPVGGQFLDGRSDDLAQQVFGPFLNPLEMANKDESQLLDKVKSASYWIKFSNYFNLNDSSNHKKIKDSIIRAIVAYEKSEEFGLFTSKYDYWLNGQVRFTYMEQLGFRVFERKNKGNCAACHSLKKQHKDDRPLLTDFSYDNIGVPANSINPFYQIPKKYNPQGKQYTDYGLGKSPRMKNGNYIGMFKVPSLRNVELTAPYMHNGVFNTLKEVVEFYNSRDLESKWGKPEVPYNVNQQELGDLQLTNLEQDALIVFMKTLTDGYQK